MVRVSLLRSELGIDASEIEAQAVVGKTLVEARAEAARIIGEAQQKAAWIIGTATQQAGEIKAAVDTKIAAKNKQLSELEAKVKTVSGFVK